MTKSSKAEKVLCNPVLISKIASYLRYDCMKSYRQINKLWRFEVTKLTRPLTRVCVNEDNIDAMLYGSNILGLSLHIRWSSLITLGFRNLLQKYARYIQSLSWFVDGSGSVGLFNEDKAKNVIAWDLQDIFFPKVTELYLILTAFNGGPAQIYGIIPALISKCPNLVKLRIEAFDVNLNFARVLQEIKSANFQYLISLHIGKGVNVHFNDFKVIKNMTPKIQNLIWEAPITFDTTKYQSVFQGLWMASLLTLELNSFSPSALPRMPNLKRLSIKSAAVTNYSPQLFDQFPLLQDLNFSLQPGHDWTTWIPKNMPPHLKIRSLTWTSKERLSADHRTCLKRLISKLPYLKSLTCPADDDFVHVICKTLPCLTKLHLIGDQCSDSGITGIPLLDLCQIAMSVDLSIESTKTNIIESYKTKQSISDLKELEDLTLMHTGITDLSISLAISGMTALRKLHLSGVTMVGILDLLQHLKLDELGVPQPRGKTISLEDIVLLQRSSPHIKIITGWDAEYFQSCLVKR